MKKPSLDDFLGDAIKKYAAEASPEVKRLEELVGAYDSVEKAEKYLKEARAREQKASKAIEEADRQAREMLENARYQADTLREEARKDRDRAKHLHVDAQAIKSKLTNELAQKEEELRKRKSDLDKLQSDLERRERQVEQREQEIENRKNKILEAASGR